MYFKTELFLNICKFDSIVRNNKSYSFKLYKLFK